MISIARGFGAPDSVPAALGQLARDSRDDMHDVGIAFDLHKFDNLDGARFAHPPEIVPTKVNQHQVLCTFLVVGE